MDQRSSSSQRILATLAILLVITAFILVGLSAFKAQNTKTVGKTPANSEQAYQAGYQAAKQEIAKSQSGTLDVKVINGTVQSVDGSEMKIQQTSFTGGGDSSAQIRTVKLNSSTQVTFNQTKSPEAFAAELRAYMKNNTSGKLAAPERVTVRTGTLADLKAGQNVTVESSQDIRTATEFTATKVLIQE